MEKHETIASLLNTIHSEVHYASGERHNRFSQDRFNAVHDAANRLEVMLKEGLTTIEVHAKFALGARLPTKARADVEYILRQTQALKEE